MKKRMLSGIKPTGQLHLGSYIGALKHFVEYQDDYDVYAFIANLHCITVPQDPKTLQKNLKKQQSSYRRMSKHMHRWDISFVVIHIWVN